MSISIDNSEINDCTASFICFVQVLVHGCGACLSRSKVNEEEGAVSSVISLGIVLILRLRVIADFKLPFPLPTATLHIYSHTPIYRASRGKQKLTVNRGHDKSR